MVIDQDTTNSFKIKSEILGNEGKDLIDIICTRDLTQETVFYGFKNHLIRQKLSEKTIEIYMNYHSQFIISGDGREINQDLINSFLDKHNSTPARAYLKQLLAFLRNKEIEVPKLKGRKPRKKPNIMSDEEREKIATYLYNWNLKYGLAFDLIDTFALRRGELVGITIRDFDWENWKLDQSKTCKLKVRTKGGKEKYFPVSPKLMQGILLYLKKVPQEEDRPFFKMKYRRLDAVFRKACAKCLKKHYKLHEIRHSRATSWYQEGKDLVQIKTRLGHANLSTTSLYINPDEEEEFEKWEQEQELS